MSTCKVRRWFGITITIFSCLVVSISALKENNDQNSKTCDCGIIKSSRGGRVINGTDVHPQDKFPWMVRLMKEGNKTFCSGTLISPRVILTAAHCLKKPVTELTSEKEYLECLNNHCKKDCWLDPSNFSIQFATTYIPEENQVLKIHPHKLFNQEIYRSDIAMIILKKALPCTDSSRPICLPYTFKKVRNGQRFTIAGWGTSSIMKEEFSETLKEGNLKVIEEDQCKSFKTVQDNPNSVICLSGEGKQTSCTGDSGCPIMQKYNSTYYQFGISSLHFNYHCDPYEPVIFTDVIYYLPWIREKLKKYA